jgi:peroxiredoxin
MAISAPLSNLGWKAPDFELNDTYGNPRTLDTLRGPNGLVVMFICNHCPYVKAIIDRICRDAVEIQAMGVGVAAIMSNNDTAYPEDSYANMQLVAKLRNFSFPYLHDPTQQVAHAFGAVCTPDFYGFNRNLELQYRGRLDSAGIGAATTSTRRELVAAMRQIVATGEGPEEQIACIGCSIKWNN